MNTNYLIHYHHIGGRGAKFPIHIPQKLRDGVNMTLYDADQECIEEAKKVSQNQGFNKVNILPYCIDAIDASNQTFTITKQPHASSLLKGNLEFYEYIRNSSKYGAMRLQELLSPHKAISLSTKKLSSILTEEKIEHPDFISLDIQGKEYDVIFSSKEIFRDVLLVNTEVCFSDIYQNQKRFPEIHQLMTELGFILCDLKLYDPHHICQTPIDFEGKGFLLDGEAFYIKKPDFMKWEFIKIVKYCFAAILCQQTHLCVKVFDLFEHNWREKIEKLGGLPYTYLSLINELKQAYFSSIKVELPFFHESDIYHNYFTKKESNPIALTKKAFSEKGLEENQFRDILEKYELYEFKTTILKNKEKNLIFFKEGGTE